MPGEHPEAPAAQDELAGTGNSEPATNLADSAAPAVTGGPPARGSAAAGVGLFVEAGDATLEAWRESVA